MAAVAGRADEPLPAEVDAVIDPYEVVGPQRKEYVVDREFGSTVPARMALLGPIDPAAPVVTIGAWSSSMAIDDAAQAVEGTIAMAIAASSANDGRSIPGIRNRVQRMVHLSTGAGIGRPPM
jgi:hypothetical protein